MTHVGPFPTLPPLMEMCKLTASREGRRIEFEVAPGQPVVLGRSRECEVMLSDPEVSRQHCRIAAANGRLLVTDLDSSHGIVYRGSRVQTIDIELGDGFHLGHTFVRFDAILHDHRQVDVPTPPAAVATAAPTLPVETIDLPQRPLAAAAPVPAPEAMLEATAVGQPITDLPPGTRLGGFVIDRPIGRSDRCTVYEATQASLQRRVALKVLQVLDGRVGEQERAAFLADAQAAAAVRDGVLVPVLETGQDGAHCYTALELVEGPPLSASLLAGQRMHWRELLPVLADVAQALHRLHEQGHVHGAVKPSNVFALLRGGGRLADLRSGTQLRPRETTAYSAPELLKGLPLDAPADMYALGCVAYAVLTGRPPYWGSPKQILDEQRTRRPADLSPLDSTMPRGLDALVCGQMLALDPADRPVSAAACRDALLAMSAPGGGMALPLAAVAAPRPVAPVAVQVQTPRDVYEDVDRGQPVRRQPSAAKSFGAKLAADTIIFGVVSVVLLALLFALKVATRFDIYELFGVK